MRTKLNKTLDRGDLDALTLLDLSMLGCVRHRRSYDAHPTPWRLPKALSVSLSAGFRHIYNDD